MRLAIIVLVLSVPLPTLAQMQEAAKPLLLSPEIADSLVMRGARIGRIELDEQNVFDPSKPDEDKRLYKVANRIHVTTREQVVESALLFKPGDLYDPVVLRESERLIRSRGSIADAFIVPNAYNEETNTVDILVTTRDSWSLSTNINFGRSGGKNHSGFGFEEKNLLGTGMHLNVLHESDVDRNRNSVGFGDPDLFRSRVRLSLNYADASDGSTQNVVLGRPFYALDTRWSLDSAFLQEDRIDHIYDLGEPIAGFQHQVRASTISGGWSRGYVDGRVTRWLAGFTSDQHTFLPAPDLTEPSLPPDDRQLVYPWVGFQMIEDDYRQFVELNDMGRIEDVQLGLSLIARLGYSTEQLGADRNAWLLDFTANKGWQPSESQLVTAEFDASTRHETSGFRNTILRANTTYYHKMFDRQMLMASFDAVVTDQIDLDQQILLGGDSGLRGFPLRYQSGSSRALIRLEDRFFTDWYPFKLVRVGYAAFVDAGRTWGEDPRTTPSYGMLYDAGFGLRLSSPRSSSGTVIHIDLAAPLNGPASVGGVQLSVRTKSSF
jgi:hypothetical protein